jgi:hypothetical protein
MTGKATNKDSLTATLISGSNAAGEALPPHFQFQMKATSGNRDRIRSEVFAFTPHVIGQFETANEWAWDCTFGLNTKGEMDYWKFELYITNSILPHYPNTLDRPGKRLILKCNSGPGRLQIDLLAKLRHLGVYLYPCVPNTTAVTHETDHTYGKFKTRFRTNLEQLVNECITQDLPVKVLQYKLALLVFGGKDPETGLKLPSTFEFGFGCEECLNLWRKVGAMPLTRASLKDPRVARAIGDGEDEYSILLRSIQEANHYAVYALTKREYKGSAMQALPKAVPEASVLNPITERHSKEHFCCLPKRTPMVRSSMQLGGAMFVLMIFLRQKQFVAGMTK